MRTTDRPLRGILYVNIALVIDAGNEALVKLLTAEYSPIQIGFVRSLLLAVVAGLIILATKRYHLFVTRRIGLLTVRGVLSAVPLVTVLASA